MLIGVADEFGFKVKTFQHVLEGYKVADEIARHGAGASTFADFWGYKIEAYDAIPYNAAIMTRHGVVASVNSDSDERARRLNIEAAKMMKYGGLTEEEALKLITLNPAIAARHDKTASAPSTWARTPTSPSGTRTRSRSTRASRQTFVDGELLFDRQAGHRAPPAARSRAQGARSGRAEPRARAGRHAAAPARRRSAAPTRTTTTSGRRRTTSDEDNTTTLSSTLSRASRSRASPRSSSPALARRRSRAGHRRPDAAMTNTPAPAPTSSATRASSPSRGPDIENGAVVISGGRISAVGANVNAPAGAQEIDARGLVVYPGMIDAGTNMGLGEISARARPAPSTRTELGDMNPNVRRPSAVNPHSSHIDVTRVAGVTSVVSLPAGGVISGQAAFLNLAGSTPREMAVVPQAALVIDFPRVGGGGGFARSSPRSRASRRTPSRQRDRRVEELRTHAPRRRSLRPRAGRLRARPEVRAAPRHRPRRSRRSCPTCAASGPSSSAPSASATSAPPSASPRR